MKTTITIRTHLFHWTIRKDSQILGALRLPVFSQFFFRSGDALLQLSGTANALTYPKRAADVLGAKEAPVQLKRADEILFEVNREKVDGVTRFYFSWQAMRYEMVLKENAWIAGKMDAPLLRIAKSGKLFTQYEILIAQSTFPVEFAVATVWAIACPLDIL